MPLYSSLGNGVRLHLKKNKIADESLIKVVTIKMERRKRVQEIFKQNYRT